MPDSEIVLGKEYPNQNNTSDVWLEVAVELFYKNDYNGVKSSFFICLLIILLEVAVELTEWFRLENKKLRHQSKQF